MDFRLTVEQRELQAAVRALLAGRFGPERLRAAVDDDGGGPAPVLWAELRRAGVFGLRGPDGADGSDGRAGSDGLGLGLAEAVLVFEELGRALVPGPLVATELAGALGLDGTAALVRLPAGRGPLLVEQLPRLDLLLVLDTGSGELRRVDPAEVAAGAEPVRAVDPLTPLWRVDAALPSGTLLDRADAALVWTEGTLLTAALQVGLADRAVRSAVVHAGRREQFGQPIGAFQAVQHLCADMLARLEPARVAVRAAAVVLDADGATPAARAAVAGAKLLADEAAVRGARDCLQVHGGMGFTWEADVQLLLKRSWVWQHSFADSEECAELLSRQLLL